MRSLRMALFACLLVGSMSLGTALAEEPDAWWVKPPKDQASAEALAAAGARQRPITVGTDDHVCAHIVSIGCGAAVSGTITTADCPLGGTYFDDFAFTGVAGQRVTILATSTDMDMYLYLRDPNGILVDQDDQSGGGNNAKIVYTLGTTGTWRIIVNTWNFDTGSYNLSLSCGTAARGDFNGNSRSDIFWRDPTSGSNVTWLMNGFTASGAATTSIDPAYQVAGTGDFDGDGTSDIVWRNQNTGANYMWLMSGQHPWNGSPFTTLAPPWVIAGVGDVNLDGMADIVWHNPANGANAIWLMNTFNVINGSSIATVPDTNFNIVAVHDFNGDGKADLLWRNSSTGQNHIWLMNGLNVLSTSSIPSVPDLNYFVAGTGDFNGDARNDILWRNNLTGGMYIWLMDGFSSNGSPLPSIGDVNWRPRAVGDFDGDGKADIMLRHAGNGQNYLWIMNGVSVANGGPLPAVTALSWNPQVPK